MSANLFVCFVVEHLMNDIILTFPCQKMLFQSIFYVLINKIYYIPITDRTLELSVFWPSDTESRINELRFSESISLSFKTRLTSVTCFCGDVT